MKKTPYSSVGWKKYDYILFLILTLSFVLPIPIFVVPFFIMQHILPFLLLPFLFRAYRSLNKKAVIGIFIFLFFMIVSQNVGSYIQETIFKILGQEAPNLNQNVAESGLKENTAYLVFLIVFIAPIFEEYICRYGIQTIVRERINSKTIAVLVSSFVFAFAHVVPAIIEKQPLGLIHIIVYFLMGVVLGISFEKYKNISVPITVHMLSNLLATISILSQ